MGSLAQCSAPRSISMGRFISGVLTMSSKPSPLPLECSRLPLPIQAPTFSVFLEQRRPFLPTGLPTGFSGC